MLLLKIILLTTFVFNLALTKSELRHIKGIDCDPPPLIKHNHHIQYNWTIDKEARKTWLRVHFTMPWNPPNIYSNFENNMIKRDWKEINLVEKQEAEEYVSFNLRGYRYSGSTKQYVIELKKVTCKNTVINWFVNSILHMKYNEGNCTLPAGHTAVNIWIEKILRSVHHLDLGVAKYLFEVDILDDQGIIVCIGEILESFKRKT